MEMKASVIYRRPGTHPILECISGSNIVDAILTTDNSASNYNLPVVVIDGQAMGPADLTLNYPGYELAIVPEHTDTEPVTRIVTDAQKAMIDLADKAGYNVYKY